MFGNLKHCLLDSLFNIKRQSEMAKTKLFEGDCRGELTNSFPFSLPILLGYYIPGSSFGVNMMQMTKCSQEDKVWLTVIVF